MEASIGVKKETQKALLQLRLDARLKTMDELLNVLMSEYLKGHISASQVVNSGIDNSSELVNSFINSINPGKNYLHDLNELIQTEAMLTKRIIAIEKEMHGREKLRKSSKTRAIPEAINPSNLNPGTTL